MITHAPRKVRTSDSKPRDPRHWRLLLLDAMRKVEELQRAGHPVLDIHLHVSKFSNGDPCVVLDMDWEE